LLALDYARSNSPVRLAVLGVALARLCYELTKSSARFKIFTDYCAPSSCGKAGQWTKLWPG
jgi:hypothetical protein